MKNKLSRLLFWYWALLKRLLKRPSFIIILLLIPLFTLLMSQAAEEESGFVSIAVVQEDETDEAATAVVEKITADSKIAVITHCVTESEAKSLVETGEVDTAWIVLGGLRESAKKIAAGGDAQLVRIYMTEDNTFVRAAREKLLGVLYPLISYEVYELQAQALPLAPEYMTPENLKDTYNAYGDDDGIIEYSFLNSSQSDLSGVDYLTAPLRGLLCTVMLLCGMAAALYYSTDDKEGIFSNLTAGKRAWVFLANNLAALTLSGIFVSVALRFSGTYTSFWRESLFMMLYILACTGFCTLLGALLGTPAKLSVSLPIVLIAAVALSPVFFNIRRLAAVQSLLPLYHYLYGINDIKMAASLALWAVFYIAAAVYVYTYRNRGYIKR